MRTGVSQLTLKLIISAPYDPGIGKLNTQRSEITKSGGYGNIIKTPTIKTKHGELKEQEEGRRREKKLHDLKQLFPYTVCGMGAHQVPSTSRGQCWALFSGTSCTTLVHHELSLVQNKISNEPCIMEKAHESLTKNRGGPKSAYLLKFWLYVHYFQFLTFGV
ncbi:unnamed protein product [Sphenostylis stenocarpa]|uniref:Uncharacterized protein n=1 Tax=Sphenostylis stenocarpa TaxID=92480 RepID=A0AA86T496_9FABA|nr:unnamed protein product [Sphenostylis stenocarpa]